MHDLCSPKDFAADKEKNPIPDEIAECVTNEVFPADETCDADPWLFTHPSLDKCFKADVPSVKAKMEQSKRGMLNNPKWSGCQGNCPAISVDDIDWEALMGKDPIMGEGFEPWIINMRANMCRSGARETPQPGLGGIFYSVDKTVYLHAFDSADIFSKSIDASSFEDWQSTDTAETIRDEKTWLLRVSPGSGLQTDASLTRQLA